MWMIQLNMNLHWYPLHIHPVSRITIIPLIQACRLTHSHPRSLHFQWRHQPGPCFLIFSGQKYCYTLPWIWPGDIYKLYQGYDNKLVSLLREKLHGIYVRYFCVDSGANNHTAKDYHLFVIMQKKKNMWYFHGGICLCFRCWICCCMLTYNKLYLFYFSFVLGSRQYYHYAIPRIHEIIL